MGAPGVSMREYRKMQLLRSEIVAEMYKRGHTYQEIRSEVMARLNLATYSMQTVHKDVHRLLSEWREYRLDKVDEAVQLELERLRDLQKEAWEAWEKSKKDYDRERLWRHGIPRQKKEGEEKGTSMETTHITQQKENIVNCGDPRYLDTIFKCGVEVRKLLGLYAPEKREITGKDGKELNPTLQIEVIDRRDQVDNEDSDN